MNSHNGNGRKPDTTDSRENVKKHFNSIAKNYEYWKRKNSYYYSLLKEFYGNYIPQGSSVIEFGCATADILASCKPKRGMGIDVSEEMITRAKEKYPHLEFRVADAHGLSINEKFDYVIMCDLLDHVSDIPKVIENAYEALNPGGKLLCTTINPFWNPLMTIAERLKLKMPEGPHSFIPNRFLELFCRIKGFNVSAKGALVFIPKRIPLVSRALNRIIPRVVFLKRFCWVQVLIAEKKEQAKKKLDYSVIVPLYNEEGNVEECIRSISRVQERPEIIAVNDGSTDGTALALERLQKEMDNLKVVSFSRNMGKAFAVESGIKAAGKEALVIFDADMAPSAESIPLFIEPLNMGIADFVNGTRLVYDMEKNAMSQVRRIGNFIFAVVFSRILRTSITDTLCGVKAFLKKDFQAVEFKGEKWGDFVLLEAARRKGLKIVEVPLRYYARTSGTSKMNTYKDGLRFMLYLLKIMFRQ